ncbi:MAG: hypothetical protein H6Q48_220, partial [Deltaproteobacteria bacterium]|nr:hypothetical protein [Deltaproteobacteria bacterium]
MKNTYGTILVVLLWFVCSPVSAFPENSPSVPWDLLPRITALDESRKTELMEV